MSFLDYFKERIIFILINIGIILLGSSILIALNVDSYAIIFVGILNFIGSIIYHIYDFYRKRSYYNEVISNLQSLDKKYLISDLIREGDFLDSKIVYSIIEEATKSMKDYVSETKRNIGDYKEYIELWVHEVKTPIATCKLLVENNESKATNSIGEEIDRVEDYIEQALFYTRSNNIEKDYLIKELNILNIINQVINRNANILIQKGINIKIENVDRIVYSDSKWVQFILHQIISNSIKYMEKDHKILKIYSEEKDNNIILHIEDNGIGMNEKSVIRVFEKGYTGENGRRFGKSTGIGLYLCKKLCIKLGLGIKINSKENEGTTVSILFPINKMMIFS